MDDLDLKYQTLSVVGDFVGLQSVWLGRFVPADDSPVFN